MRVGVFGGSFNPIHLGHLHVARRTERLFSFSEIHFVVATIPPHKNPTNLIPLNHRYAMVSLASAGNPAFVPSLVELEPPASPYSIHTMGKLSRRYAGRLERLYFIAGGDSLAEVAGWRESRELLSAYDFVFVMRPGAGPEDVAAVLPPRVVSRVLDLRGLGSRKLRERIAGALASKGRCIFILDLAAPDISASEIRDRVRSGRRIRHLVPPAVYEYIHKLHLYGERCKTY